MQSIDKLLEAWELTHETYLSIGQVSLTYNAVSTKLNGILIGIDIHGQNVAIFADNSIEYILIYWANILNGNTNVPINVQLTESEIESEIDYCDCNWVFCKSSFAQKVQAICLKMDVGLVSIDEHGKIDVIQKPQNLKSRGNGSDIAVMLHTSGTTGTPKKVMLTHSNLIANTASVISSQQLTQADTVLIALPMFFGYCHTSQFLTHTRLGGKIVIYDEKIFTPKHFCQLVERHAVTCFTAVPTMLTLLDRYPYLSNHDLSSLRYVCFGGGAASTTLLQSLMHKLPNVGFVQTYGQTECSPRVTALMPPDAIRKIGSVGKTIPGVDICLFDENLERLEVANEIGQIAVRGENTTPGYYKRPEETKKIKHGEWLLTGDLGKIDDEGYLWLVGRKKNVVISGGLKVYPEEVEAILGSLSGVQECIVKGEAHEILGEVPVADVVLKEGFKIDEKGLLDQLKDKLAQYKIPKKLYFKVSLPKTSTGKIRRNALQAGANSK